MKILLAAVVCVLCTNVRGLTIDTYPSNQTSILGRNVTFACEVTKTDVENVFWKRVEGSSTTLIGYNSLSKNTTKYVITGTFNLTILDVYIGDEGYYECEAGQTKPQAYLQVAVVPPLENITVAWENASAPVLPKIESKLVCSVYNSRPPATIRWFKGNTDVTKDVSFHNSTMTSAGYGDSLSVLNVTPAPDDNGALYHCKVDLPDNPAVRTKTVTLKLGSGSSHIVGSYLITVAVALVLRV